MRELLVDDGENQAVRSFLMQYSCDRSISVKDMQDHMRRSGWDGCWPKWTTMHQGHLTKGGAQDWIRHLFRLEPCRAQPERKLTDAPVWVPITDYGQVKVGDKLRFTLCGETHNRKAKLILNAGTDQEEIIYDKGRNYYLITSMVIAGKGSQKNVEVLAAQPAAATVPDATFIDEGSMPRKTGNPVMYACDRTGMLMPFRCGDCLCWSQPSLKAAQSGRG